MCQWVIYIVPGSVYIFPPAEKADQSWEYINHSQTHECGNWDWDPDIPFLGIFVSKFRYFVFAVHRRAGWYDSPMLEPTLSPVGVRIWLLAITVHWGHQKKLQTCQRRPWWRFLKPPYGEKDQDLVIGGIHDLQWERRNWIHKPLPTRINGQVWPGNPQSTSEVMHIDGHNQYCEPASRASNKWIHKLKSISR